MAYIIRKWRIRYSVLFIFLGYTFLLIVSINENIEKDSIIEEMLEDNKNNLELIIHKQLEISEAKTRDVSTKQIPVTKNHRKTLKEMSQTTNSMKIKIDLTRGEHGQSVLLSSEEEKEHEAVIKYGWDTHYFNQFVSDLISVNRSLLDPRDSWCKEPNRYLKNLPSTSVIICFHNEALSVLLRTVHSILNRSPPHLLAEIILVDDLSTMDHLGLFLQVYMEHFPKVKIIRNKKREGLIRSRLIGMKQATAPIITFLDSHCECCEGWLEPLLDRIAKNPYSVVSPVIDVINDVTFGYMFSPANATQVGGFDWDLTFDWHQVPYDKAIKRSNPNEPLETPAIAGGLFSIDRKYFEKLGTYDSDLDFWGGENLELSLKVWMCGGKLEILPCSHVGHIFRANSPIKWEKNDNTVDNNLARVADVWMDEYADFYFDRKERLPRPKNVTQRKLLRKRLGCKSFQWYLDNIYPELTIPGRVLAKGALSNVITPSKCLDSSCQFSDYGKHVIVYPCHNMGGNQYWVYSEDGYISRYDHCLHSEDDGSVTIGKCIHNESRFWYYNPLKHQVHNNFTRECLSVNTENDHVELKPCNISDTKQQWTFENYKN